LFPALNARQIAAVGLDAFGEFLQGKAKRFAALAEG
jgi:hypothetical protein